MSMESNAMLAIRLAAEKRRESEASYSMRYLGDPGLLAPCKRLVDASDIPVGLVDAMRRVMNEQWAEGLGLSANQVGASIRFAIARLTDAAATAKVLESKNPKDWKAQRREVLLINPRIVDASPEIVIMVEGCLSVPNFRANLKRHTWVDVAYFDEGFVRRTLHLEGLDAQIVQHECQHLDGGLITDGLSRQLRRQAERTTAKFTGGAR